MTPSQKDAIEGVVALFEEAEIKVKQVEQLAQELSIPSINELRYVGYHLAQALCEGDQQALDAQIEKATGHCKRAIYDAHEAGVIYMLEQVRIFKEAYSPHASTVLEVIPAYTTGLASSNQATKFIAQIQEHHHNNRDGYYQACAPHYKTLRAFVDELFVAEPLINTRITEKAAKDRTQTRRFIATCALSLFGFGISIWLT